MISTIYRLLFLLISLLLVVGLVRGKTLHERLTYAFVVIPFALRALNIK